MKRWLWFFSALMISTGVYFTIRYGLQPKPIPVLNPTEFENLEQVGAVIYKRLRQEIRAERILLLGSSPELKDFPHVWTGLLKTAMADEVKIDVVFHRDLLPAPQVDYPTWDQVAVTDTMLQSGDFLNQVKARMQSGHLLVIHDLTTQVSHLMKNSLSRELDSLTHHPVLAISTLSLSLSQEERDSLQARCVQPVPENEDETRGETRIGCAAARVGKALLKKKPLPGKIWAVMERHGLKEYLVFIHN